MSIEKERLSTALFLPPWVRMEHKARFIFAADWCRDKEVLDCACGSGEGTAIFAQTASRVYAVDISKEALKEAEARVSGGGNVSFLEGSAIDLPMKDGSVDVYVSLETIEHLDSDDTYLREAYRVLRDDGIFICSTPNRAVTNPGKTISEKPANPFHVREYDEDQFLDILNRYFDSIVLHGQNPAVPGAVRMLNVLGSFLPFNFATRIHQLNKLILHTFRDINFYQIRRRKEGEIFEYMTAVCSKRPVQK